MKDVKFDSVASKYDNGFEGKLSERFYRNLVDAVNVQDGSNVLDVGCGTGTILKRISKKANIMGYGIDVSEAMLAQAKKKCPKMIFMTGDCSALPSNDNSKDVVTACMAYHHFPSQEGFRKEAMRVLKPNGMLYICDPLFPSFIRAILNRIFRISHTDARFYSMNEIVNDFVESGYKPVKSKKDRYVGLYVFRKPVTRGNV